MELQRPCPAPSAFAIIAASRDRAQLQRRDESYCPAIPAPFAPQSSPLVIYNTLMSNRGTAAHSSSGVQSQPDHAAAYPSAAAAEHCNVINMADAPPPVDAQRAQPSLTTAPAAPLAAPGGDWRPGAAPLVALPHKGVKMLPAWVCAAAAVEAHPQFVQQRCPRQQQTLAVPSVPACRHDPPRPAAATAETRTSAARL